MSLIKIMANHVFFVSVRSLISQLRNIWIFDNEWMKWIDSSPAFVFLIWHLRYFSVAFQSSVKFQVESISTERYWHQSRNLSIATRDSFTKLENWIISCVIYGFSILKAKIEVSGELITNAKRILQGGNDDLIASMTHLCSSSFFLPPAKWKPYFLQGISNL